MYNYRQNAFICPLSFTFVTNRSIQFYVLLQISPLSFTFVTDRSLKNRTRILQITNLLDLLITNYKFKEPICYIKT
jgi:hypothetical protein